MWSDTRLPVFQRNILPPSSQAVGSSDTDCAAYTPEDHSFYTVKLEFYVQN